MAIALPGATPGSLIENPMKDGTNTDMLRGAVEVSFDPEISEWGNLKS